MAIPMHTASILGARAVLIRYNQVRDVYLHLASLPIFHPVVKVSEEV